MKKFFFIGFYIFWLSLFLYIFFRLIHPTNSTDTNVEKLSNKPSLNSWTEPVTQITFNRLPAGCFDMGSPRHEKNRGDDEGPVKNVCLDAFWISTHEITVNQFQKFVDASGYQTQAETDGFSWTYDGKWKRRNGLSWKNPEFNQTGDHPVIHLTYLDIMAMARWLSNLQYQFTLPTEMQWEYACRGGSSQSRYFGEDIVKTCAYANIADHTIQQKYQAWTVHPCNDSFTFTAPVGSLLPNAFGLYDMLGNVWEWCLDVYHHQTYLNKHAVLRVSSEWKPVVIRGGSWYSRPEFVRCANRDYVASCIRRSSDLGFRLVMH